MSACRCGHTGTGPHPCHGRAYTCRAPATRRFYDARPAALAGVQAKVVALETWACDACWARRVVVKVGNRKQRGAGGCARRT